MQKLVWKNSIGDEINLTNGNYGITEWEGFANTSLNIQSQQVPFQDGGVFLDALMEQRELSVTLAMNDGGNLETRYRLRRELIHALNPKLGEGYLIYTNDFISKRIKCVAQIPLFETHNSNDSGTPKASLAWTACEPYWEDLEETIVNIPNESNVEITNNGDIKTPIKVNINNVNSVIKIFNFSTGENIELTQSVNGDIEITTELGNKKIILKKSEYNLITGGEINGACIYQDSLILCGSNIFKLNFTTNKMNVIETNQPTLIFNDIEYSPQLNLFIAITYIKIYTSSDLMEWEETYSNGSGLSVVSWEDNKFKVGRTNNISQVVSEDGVNWVSQSDVINKTKNKVYFKNNYYRINNFKIQKSNDNINWTDVTDSIFPNSILVAYGKIYAFCIDSSIYITDDGNNWICIRERLRLKKSCIVYNKLYFINDTSTNFIYYLDDNYNLINIKVDDELIQCIDIFYKNNILLLLTMNGIYTSIDGLNFEKTASYGSGIGNIFYNDDIDKYCIYLEDFSSRDKKLYTSSNGFDWSIDVLNFSQYVFADTGKMIFFNGYYYLGFVDVSTSDSKDKIIKTNDFLTFTDVYTSAEIQQDYGFNDVYSDDEQIIFVGFACIIRSINGNVFNKINYSNPNIRLNKIRKIDDKFYITGDMSQYIITDDFSVLEIVNSPQQNAISLLDINKIYGKIFYLGMIALDKDYFLGGDVHIVENNIIMYLLPDSTLNLFIEKGKNILFFSGNDESFCKIQYRQKYIGV